MPASNDLLNFLRNSEKALRHCTVDELNNAVEEFAKTKDINTECIDIVLQLVSETYDISVRTIRMSNARGSVQIARSMAYILLHIDCNLSMRYIANKFGKWSNSVQRAIIYYKRIDLKIKADKEFSDTYDKLSEKLKQKIK